MTVPRRGGRSNWPLWLLVVCLLTAAVATESVIPASSFHAAELDRGSTLDVVDDDVATLGLAKSTDVRSNDDNCLVKVTNNLGAGTATVDLHLTNGSATYADLRNPDNTSNWADSQSFPLDSGTTKEVWVRVDAATGGQSISVNVTAVASGVSFTTPDRTVPIVDSGLPNLACL